MTAGYRSLRAPLLFPPRTSGGEEQRRVFLSTIRGVQEPACGPSRGRRSSLRGRRSPRLPRFLRRALRSARQAARVARGGAHFRRDSPSAGHGRSPGSRALAAQRLLWAAVLGGPPRRQVGGGGGGGAEAGGSRSGYVPPGWLAAASGEDEHAGATRGNTFLLRAAGPGLAPSPVRAGHRRSGRTRGRWTCRCVGRRPGGSAPGSRRRRRGGWRSR